MKKIICILLVGIILCGLVACDTNNATSESKDYSAAISSLEKAMENIHNCAAIQQDWLTFHRLQQLYDDVNYLSGYNNEIDTAGQNCYNYRKTARAELNNAKEIIKGGSGELYNAVQEYYLAVSAAMDFVSNFPEGYSQITWNKKWTELEANVSSAASKVQFYI